MMGNVIHFIWDIVGWVFFFGIGMFFTVLSFSAVKDFIDKEKK